jgi:hypothetical protein
MNEKLSVVATGDRMSFYVSSETGPDDGYKVDMGALGGNGFCTCRDFQCRCEPRYVNNRQIVHYGRAERSQCKHINAVLLFLGDKVAQQAAKLYDEQERYHHHHD